MEFIIRNRGDGSHFTSFRSSPFRHSIASQFAAKDQVDAMIVTYVTREQLLHIECSESFQPKEMYAPFIQKLPRECGMDSDRRYVLLPHDDADERNTLT